jgi:DNA polymerase
VDTLVLDWETYYSQDYSLSKITTEAYVRDPRFEEILLGVKVNAAPAFWLLPDRASHFLKQEIDWANTALICHHSHFDGLILNHHHDCRPAMHIDTLSMARILDGPKAGNSLEELCIRHGIGRKGNYVTFAKGKRAADFTGAERNEYGQYCINDCERTYDLAQIFMEQMPADELKLVDLTVRMFTEPRLLGNETKLRGAVTTEQKRKRDLLTELGYECKACGGSGQVSDLISGVIPCKLCDGLGINKKPFNSSDKFAAILRSIGVEPKTKPSPTTGEQIFAFARTDPAMQEMLEDPDEVIRALAEARVSIRSGIVETRAQRFADMASRGPLCVYLNYGGAHTFRWSGGDSTNFQNMSNHNENRPELAVLKQSIYAPDGYRIVCSDSAQGEARLLSWAAQQDDLTQAFREGRDVYSEHASTVYGRPVDRKKNPADKIPGHVGKVGILSFGFGSGWFKAATEFLKGALGAKPIIFTMADLETLQIDPSPFLNNPKHVQRVAEMPSRLNLNDRLIHCCVTKALVDRYRKRYLAIPAFWGYMEQIIGHMIAGDQVTFGAHGIMTTGKDFILMPNNLKLNYHGLERSDDGTATYWDGRSRTKIYGSLLTENIIQSLHRIVVGEQMIEIAKELDVVLMTHDEIVCVVEEGAADLALQFMNRILATTPSWATGLPLSAEGGIGVTYAECK